MAAAEHNSISLSSLHADTPIISQYPNRVAELVEEIDRLRKAMTETFLRERSLVADSVMELSRQLDLKINEYMKQVLISREEVR
ncbi:aspartyl-phosphate phosphatase Spo0E family protein [Cohnella herbarum]|uniref:Aspartyl-phosphate phosphatase Spo0E family protein n=1 Tax=Cohnella herbarum TaxID=2728023 RepID=A0A7Z2VQW5_9BACL|nr:aspartyl-phosphate phosphatase Spo0E family protein [Cohnella herbarum]QJD87564.1 aspartyl-phosphate phosphatase Spo0E family protein [Cohnella herbarum]